MFILQLNIYARYPGKTDLKLEPGFEASVVAAEEIKNEYNTSAGVEIFASLAIIMPIFVLILIWLYVYGARAHVRRHINNADNYPTIAALYWIGQTFTVFVIIMDILAIYPSVFNNTKPHNLALQSYQFTIIIAIMCFELCFLILSFFLTLISVSSHLNILCKKIVKWVFKHVCYGIFFYKAVKRREARLWLCCSGFIPPVISLSSHIGFIIGGWISYGERSTAIVLYYLFIFIFLYWSLPYVYIFFVRKRTYASVTKTHKINNNPVRVLFQYRPLNEDEDPEVQILPQPENPDTEWSIHDTNIKREGFNAIALFVMLPIVIILDGLIAYVGVGILYLPLLESIDELFIRIYVIGEYVLAIGVFLISYRLFSGKAGWGNNGSVSDDSLKFWTFLNSVTDAKDYHYQQLPILHHTMNSLLLAVRACGSKKVIANKILVEARKRFDKVDEEIPIVSECKILEDFFRHCLKHVVSYLRQGVYRRNDSEVVPIFHMEEKFTAANDMLDLAEIYAKFIKKPFREEDSKALKALEPLCKGIKHVKETLLCELDIPPIHSNRDKANALAAALIFEKVKTQRVSTKDVGSCFVTGSPNEIPIQSNMIFRKTIFRFQETVVKFHGLYVKFDEAVRLFQYSLTVFREVFCMFPDYPENEEVREKREKVKKEREKREKEKRERENGQARGERERLRVIRRWMWYMCRRWRRYVQERGDRVNRQEDRAHSIKQVTEAIQETTAKFHVVYAKFCCITSMFHGTYDTYLEIVNRFRSVTNNLSTINSEFKEIVTNCFDAVQNNYKAVHETTQTFCDTDPSSAAIHFAKFLRIDTQTERSQLLRDEATKMLKTLIKTGKMGTEFAEKFVEHHEVYKSNVSAQFQEMIAMLEAMTLAAGFKAIEYNVGEINDFVVATEQFQKIESEFHAMAKSANSHREQPTSAQKYEERYSLLLSLIEEEF